MEHLGKKAQILSRRGGDNKEENPDVPASEEDLDAPIAPHKGVRSCRIRVKYPLGQYMS